MQHNPSSASTGMNNAEEKEESLLPSRVGARVAALEAKQNAPPSQPQSPADSNSGSEGSRSAYGSGTPGGGGKIRDMLHRLQSVEGDVILVREGVCNAPHHKGAGNLLCPMAGKIKISVHGVERLVCSKHAKKPPNFLLATGWYAVEPEGLERNTEATADHFTRFNPNHKGAEYILNVFELSAEAEAAMEAIAQPLDLSKLPAVPAPAKAAGKSSGAVMVGQPAAGAGGVKTATNISGGNNGISDPLLVGVMGGGMEGGRGGPLTEMELAERQQQHQAANNWSRAQEASSHAVSGGAQAAMSGLGYTGLGGIMGESGRNTNLAICGISQGQQLDHQNLHLHQQHQQSLHQEAQQPQSQQQQQQMQANARAGGSSHAGQGVVEPLSGSVSVLQAMLEQQNKAMLEQQHKQWELQQTAMQQMQQQMQQQSQRQLQLLVQALSGNSQQHHNLSAPAHAIVSYPCCNCY